VFDYAIYCFDISLVLVISQVIILLVILFNDLFFIQVVLCVNAQYFARRHTGCDIRLMMPFIYTGLPKLYSNLCA
jgi:hypothetical protein